MGATLGLIMAINHVITITWNLLLSFHGIRVLDSTGAINIDWHNPFLITAKF